MHLWSNAEYSKLRPSAIYFLSVVSATNDMIKTH